MPSFTVRGKKQAREAGKSVGLEFIEDALIFASPYRRTRETLQEMLDGVGLSHEARKNLSYYEDPRLRYQSSPIASFTILIMNREVELGYADIDEQLELRRRHGWFYYRYMGGESPADCYDRTSNFLESMMRQRNRKVRRGQQEDTEQTASYGNKVLVISHGLTIRCFIMRFLHLTVEDFDVMVSV